MSVCMLVSFGVITGNYFNRDYKFRKYILRHSEVQARGTDAHVVVARKLRDPGKLPPCQLDKAALIMVLIAEDFAYVNIFRLSLEFPRLFYLKKCSARCFINSACQPDSVVVPGVRAVFAGQTLVWGFETRKGECMFDFLCFKAGLTPKQLATSSNR